jgi:hypothetical protein
MINYIHFIAYVTFAVVAGCGVRGLVMGTIQFVQAFIRDLQAIDDNQEPPAFI